LYGGVDRRKSGLQDKYALRAGHVAIFIIHDVLVVLFVTHIFVNKYQIYF